MTEVYIHLSGRDLDNALLEMNGLSTPKAVGSKFSVKVCLRCQEHNSPDATYCKRCTYPLDAEAMEWENKAMNELLSIPQVSRYMRRMLRQIGVKR
jgi:ribosomal protein L40E